MLLSNIKIEGVKNQIFYRKGTSDETVLNVNLLRGTEYLFPDKLSPKVIVDVGANIGATALLLHKKFPKATIYAFEPVAENYNILAMNTRGIKQIKVFNYGLGSKKGDCPIFKSDDPNNHGGYSLYQKGTAGLHDKVKIEETSAAFKKLGIKKIDMLKLDCEGAECAVVAAMAHSFRNQISWIEGELHGQNDFYMLSLLELNFDIGVQKNIASRIGKFVAKNKKLML